MQNVISIQEWQERKFDRLVRIAVAGMTKKQIDRAIRDLEKLYNATGQSTMGSRE